MKKILTDIKENNFFNFDNYKSIIDIIDLQKSDPCTVDIIILKILKNKKALNAIQQDEICSVLFRSIIDLSNIDIIEKNKFLHFYKIPDPKENDDSFSCNFFSSDRSMTSSSITTKSTEYTENYFCNCKIL